MPPLHVYAIVPTRKAMVFDAVGVDGRDFARTIPHGDLAAVVSAGALDDYSGLSREQIVHYLLSHQRVVESVMKKTAVLPIKFGTVLADEAHVRLLLDQGDGLFKSMLDRLEGRSQMEVVVFWNLQDVFQEIAEEEEIVKLKAESASHTPERAMADRIAVGRMVQESLARRRTELSNLIVPDLAESATEIVLNQPMDDSMVANVALLVDESARSRLAERLELLDERFEGRLNFKCVGPLPPYSFATVEAAPLTFDAVDDARRTLGLGETASLSDIKHALTRLAGEHGPAVDAEAESRDAELTRAYKLLTGYVQARMPSAKDMEAPCSFGPEDVEATMLISVRRQDSE